MKKFRNVTKRLAGVLLAVALLLSVAQPIVVAAATSSESNSAVVSPMLEPSDIEYVGTTAFGTMLTEKMMEKQTEETGSTSYIRNATYNGWYVDVELENSENATLVVALYDETGETMYASASQSVTEDTDACSLHLDGEIPDYFLLKAFLIGYRDNVICDEYVSYLYTQEMQTLLNSTVEDYPDREILQLDDSGDNNFAVYGENAVVVSSTNSANTVIHADEETGSYVVEHIEDALRTLDKGDILSLEQPDGTTWILKVESVSITGDTATITAANAEMEEVFDFVKVDTTSREGEINVDNSNLSDGITCQSVDIASPAKRAYEGDISRSVEVAYDIDKTIAGTQSNNVKFKGSIGFTLGFQLEYYLSLNYSSLKFSIPYTFEVSAAITGKVTAWECPLCDVGFSPIPGVYIGLTPAIVLELSVALEFSFQSEAVLGYEITTGLFRGTEIQNASKAPVTSSELKLEGKVFFGLSLRPHVAIISKHIADAGMTGTAGIEFSAGMNLWEYNAETNHLCDSCLAGELGWRMELSVDIKLLNSIKIEATILEASQKICDFYYSFTKSEFGWGTCPYVYDKTHGEIV
ncbi:MAG: hypothetical protein IJA48_05620, partial [Oscillospiraceae bacterium]|nr:hypothetical protein [Oscillospiraceae bacterium]